MFDVLFGVFCSATFKHRMSHKTLAGIKLQQKKQPSDTGSWTAESHPPTNQNPLGKDNKDLNDLKTIDF